MKSSLIHENDPAPRSRCWGSSSTDLLDRERCSVVINQQVCQRLEPDGCWSLPQPPKNKKMGYVPPHITEGWEGCDRHRNIGKTSGFLSNDVSWKFPRHTCLFLLICRLEMHIVFLQISGLTCFTSSYQKVAHEFFLSVIKCWQSLRSALRSPEPVTVTSKRNLWGHTSQHKQFGTWWCYVNTSAHKTDVVITLSFQHFAVKPRRSRCRVPECQLMTGQLEKSSKFVTDCDGLESDWASAAQLAARRSFRSHRWHGLCTRYRRMRKRCTFKKEKKTQVM